MQIMKPTVNELEGLQQLKRKNACYEPAADNERYELSDKWISPGRLFYEPCLTYLL